MSRNSFVVITAAFVALTCRAQSFEVVYGFPNVTTSSGTVAPAPVPTVTGLSCGTFSAFGVGVNPNASGRFSFNGWPVGAADGADNYGTYTAALSPFSYYEFSLSPQAGYTLSLSGLSFSVRRSGTGVRNYCVRISLDGFANNLAAKTGTNNNLQIIPDDVFFWKFDNTSTTSDQRGSEVTFGNSFSGITFPVFIRFYAWNSEVSGGTFSIDDVKISGQLADSVLHSGMDEHSKYSCTLRSGEGFISHGCDLISLDLYSPEGKLIMRWVDPPFLISTSGIEPGLYIAVLKTQRGQCQQKMLLRR